MSARSRHPSAAELDRLDLVAAKGDTTIAVCLPARDEAATVGAIVAAIRDDLVASSGRHGGLVDELLVVDDRSVDDTAAAAAAAGARVVAVGDILPEVGSGAGKGNVLWKSLAATTSELVVWCDADLRNFDSRFVSGLVAPLLLDPDVVMVKGFYDRILGDDPTGGGRTTELVARPLLSLLFPHLAHVRQPLGGEYAARRRVLEQVPFAQGYGVEMGLLIDVARLAGAHRIVEVDLGQRAHRNRPLQELSAQAMEILQTALRRAGATAERDWTPVLLRPDLPPAEIEVRERPPLSTIAGYRAARTLRLEFFVETCALPPDRPARRLTDYDAVVLVSFGGPEGPDDVVPFLETVTRGRDVPRARLDEVAANYLRMGGRSPLNDANRALLAALRADLDGHGIDLPLYWGNRNWHPLLADTVAQMADDGVERALAFVTSAFSSYSSCRRYLDDIQAATSAVPGAPSIEKLRVFFNHPGFLEPQVELVAAALERLPAPLRAAASLVFTAHSIPSAMAATCDYELQLRDAAAVVAAGVGRNRWDLAFQSRSGPPAVPWLGPDVNDHLATLAEQGIAAVVAAPIGFVSDNMEVVFDLDVRTAETADRLGMAWVRAATVGTHPTFVAMVRELILERLEPERPRRWLGDLGLRPDPCHAGCCPAPAAPRRR